MLPKNTKENREIFQRNIKPIRKWLHITQDGLAEMCGVASGNLREIEKGHRPLAASQYYALIAVIGNYLMVNGCGLRSAEFMIFEKFLKYRGTYNQVVSEDGISAIFQFDEGK